MKKLFIILSLLSCFIHSVYSENNPIAAPEAIVISGNMRFTILTPEMIRIEWSETQQFEDRASFTVLNRRLPVPPFTKEERDGFLYIKTEKLSLQYRIGSFPGTFNPASSENLKITFEMDGRTQTWYPWKPDNLNLKGTMRTLDSANGTNKLSEMENGLLSRSGWAVIDETGERPDGSISLMFEPRENGVDWVGERQDKTAMDWYFLGYGHDYKKALSDFIKIAGRIPMPPMYAFGYWYSKYEEYSEQDFKDLVGEIQDHDIPLDVMVVDMDWHYSGSSNDGGRGGWTGWSWNKRLFPDPEGFLNWLHDNHLKATLNLHPADGIAPDEDNFTALANELGLPTNQTIPWRLENEEFYKAFFKHIIRPHENIGVDFWWLDWQQWLLANDVEKLGNTFWLNHVFFNDKKQQENGRPIIFHRWGGLGNHRYQVGFSGDAHANFETLAFEPYFTATASNVGYGYWSHDIGGHFQNGGNDAELFLRWIQYGVFSPILRTHSTKDASIERRIWKYDNFTLMRDAIELRYALAPYIYTQARTAYDTGISICRPLYYEWPEENEAYKHNDEYMFGDNILAAPIVERSNNNGISHKTIWLPKGNWYEVNSGDILEGNKSYTRTFTQADIPHYYKEGAIIPMYPKLSHLKSRPDKLILQFAPGQEGEFMYYEDENDNDNYQNGLYTFTKITHNRNEKEGTFTIYPREGNFNGMPTNRSYELHILAATFPQSVEVNHIPYQMGNEGNGTWNYDSEMQIIKLYIPSTSCDETIEINIIFSEESAVQTTKEDKNAFIHYIQNEKKLCVNTDQICHNIKLYLHDITGKIILEQDEKNSMGFYVNIPNSTPNGVYIVKMEYDGHQQTQRIII